MYNSKDMKKYNLIHSKWFYTFIGILLLIGIWDLISLISSNLVFPEFFFTLKNSFSLLSNREVLISIGLSLYRILITLSIAIIIGYLLGTLAGFFPILGEILKPTIYILTCFPTACLIYILIIYTKLTCYVLVGVLTFPLIYKACYLGSENIITTYEKELRLYGRYKFNNLTKVIFPLNLNNLYLGIFQTSGLALKGEIMGEVFMGDTSFKGLGVLIRKASNQDYNINNLFSLTLLAIIIMTIIDLIISILKSRVFKKYNIKETNLFNMWF